MSDLKCESWRVGGPPCSNVASKPTFSPINKMFLGIFCTLHYHRAMAVFRKYAK
jgi:hypothetical protein